MLQHIAIKPVIPTAWGLPIIKLCCWRRLANTTERLDNAGWHLHYRESLTITALDVKMCIGAIVKFQLFAHYRVVEGPPHSPKLKKQIWWKFGRVVPERCM